MDCCKVPKPASDARTRCPSCGAVGKEVGDETIQALLGPEDSLQLLALERRFCRTPGCAVLYYGSDGRLVNKDASKVRVGQKETLDPVQLCYCFDFFRSDVRAEVAKSGECSIPGRITAEVRAGRCACERMNPSGACCLGDVNRAVKEAQVALARSRERSAAAPETPVNQRPEEAIRDE